MAVPLASRSIGSVSLDQLFRTCGLVGARYAHDTEVIVARREGGGYAILISDETKTGKLLGEALLGASRPVTRNGIEVTDGPPR
jgi:hypothetical protein